MATKKSNPTVLTRDGDVMLNGRMVPYANYTVDENDSVYNVWLRFKDKTTVGAIKKANNVETNQLVVGKTIKIPMVI